MGGDTDSLLSSGGAVGYAIEKEGRASVSYDEAETVVPVNLSLLCGMAVDKDEVDAIGCDVPAGNVVSFRTNEELEAHLRALEANEEKGLNRYAGFEALYAGVDTSAPMTYVVG